MVFAQKCNTKSGEIKLSLAQFLDEETLKKYTEDDFTQNNDIIINSTGTGTLGRVGIYTNKDNPSNLPIVPDSHITTVRVFGELNAKMVFLWLKFNQAYLEDQGEGSTNQKELRPNTLAEMLIPIPPLAEQLRIESSYNSIIYLMNYLDTKKLEVSKCVELTKSKILDLAIRGKLVPQDPNDEPASVLLERIKAEKEELIKQGKIKRDKAESTIFKGDDNSYYEKVPSGWAITNLETVIDYEQPTEYLVNSTDYKNEYPTPVLTAGKSLILGYTNETNGIFTDTPVIIFDDFTTECKYVDFPFKVKSTAMKILHPNKSAILSKYAYYLMKTIQVDHENHQRYWISTFSKEHILLPPLSEQQRIIECIELYFGLLDGIAN